MLSSAVALARQKQVTSGMEMLRFDGNEHSAGVISPGIYPGIGHG